MIQAAENDDAGEPSGTTNKQMLALGGLLQAIRAYGRITRDMIRMPAGQAKDALASEAPRVYSQLTGAVLHLCGIHDARALTESGDVAFVRCILDDVEALAAALADMHPFGPLAAHADSGIDFTSEGRPLCLVYPRELRRCLENTPVTPGGRKARRAAVQAALELGIIMRTRGQGLPITLQPVAGGAVVAYEDIVLSKDHL